MREFNFKRSVIRLLIVTTLLLVGAWVALKLMQYHGDMDLLVKDLEKLGVVSFFRDKVGPWFQKDFLPFFTEKVFPKIEELARPAREYIESHMI